MISTPELGRERLRAGVSSAGHVTNPTFNWYLCEKKYNQSIFDAGTDQTADYEGIFVNMLNHSTNGRLCRYMWVSLEYRSGASVRI